MINEHTPTLQDIAAHRESWLRDAGTHYRELAHWLRGIAAGSRLPSAQRELLNLARRYDRRAERMEMEGRASDRRTACEAPRTTIINPPLA
jgi:hypothetical protein